MNAYKQQIEIRKWYKKLDPWEREAYDERVAIMEYHGEIERYKAELLAYRYMLHTQIHRHINRLALENIP